jgi:hypothetical protein
MTTPELPPLPDPFVTAGLPQSGVLAHGYSAKQMHAYAESARAPLVAEVDRLRAEVEKLLESLRDPNFVHTIMLRGVIAPIGWRRTCHLTGEVPNGEDVQLAEIVRLRQEAESLRARVAELEAAQAWRPIETAPFDGLIQLMVEGCDGERRTFAAEASYRNGEKVWIETSGWTGWTKLHPGWTPVGWLPLTTPPQKEQGNG